MRGWSWHSFMCVQLMPELILSVVFVQGLDYYSLIQDDLISRSGFEGYSLWLTSSYCVIKLESLSSDILHGDAVCILALFALLTHARSSICHPSLGVSLLNCPTSPAGHWHIPCSRPVSHSVSQDQCLAVTISARPTVTAHQHPSANLKDMKAGVLIRCLQIHIQHDISSPPLHCLQHWRNPTGKQAN